MFAYAQYCRRKGQQMTNPHMNKIISYYLQDTKYEVGQGEMIIILGVFIGRVGNDII